MLFLRTGIPRIVCIFCLRTSDRENYGKIPRTGRRRQSQSGCAANDLINGDKVESAPRLMFYFPCVAEVPEYLYIHMYVA